MRGRPCSLAAWTRLQNKSFAFEMIYLVFMEQTLPLSQLMRKSGFLGREVKLCFHCTDPACTNTRTFAKKETFENWERARRMEFGAADFDQAAYRKAYRMMHMALHKGKKKCRRFQATTAPVQPTEDEVIKGLSDADTANLFALLDEEEPATDEVIDGLPAADIANLLAQIDEEEPATDEVVNMALLDEEELAMDEGMNWFLYAAMVLDEEESP